MLKYYLSILYLTFFNLLLAQNKDPVTGTVYLDNGRVDSLIKATINFPLSESYYVFCFLTQDAVTTLGPQVIKEYKSLTQHGVKRCNEDILFIISNKDGIQPSQIERYMKEAFLFTHEQLQNIKYIVSDTLYNMVHYGGYMAKLLYIHRSYLMYAQVMKLHYINDFILPHTAFFISQQQPTVIQNDTVMLMGTDNIFPYKTGKVLLSTNLHDELIELDIQTGKLGKGFYSQQMDATDLYCQMVNDTAKCNYAKKWEYKWKKANRKAVDIAYIQYVPPYIYCDILLEAFEKNEEVYENKNDEGQVKTILKDAPTLNAFNTFLVLDTLYNKVNIYQIVDEPVQKKIEKYFLIDMGFMIKKDSSLIGVNSFYPVSKVRKYPAYSVYKIKNNKYVFEKNIPMYAPPEINVKLDFLICNVFFLSLNNHDYMIYDRDGRIFDLTSTTVSSSFIGDGRPLIQKETYPDYVEDNTPENVNYDILTVGTIYNGEYLAAVYYYQKKLICEIKNKELNTVDVINLETINGFEAFTTNSNKQNICIHDDAIIFPVLKNDKFLLYRYQIEKVCEK